MNAPHHFWLFFLLILAFACQNQQPVTEYVDMDTVQLEGEEGFGIASFSL